jgi:hypothetical protein
MPPRHVPARLLVAVAAAALVLVSAPPVHAQDIEGYAAYDGASRCAPRAKPGTEVLARWIVRTQGGAFGGISRRCSRASVSEHEEGRAFDWTLDATRPRHRAVAAGFLDLVFAPDKAGNEDASARRMGIMYIIWNDHIYKSYDDEFARQDYLSSSCRRKRSCSRTLRHRDHMHISLSRAGARGRTSWYDGRVD